MSYGWHQLEKGMRNKDIVQRNGGVDSGGYMAKLDPKGGFMSKWNAMFVVSCVIAVYVDPLFFYVPVVHKEHMCIDLDRRLMITAICLRSLFDLIYVGNIILGFLCPYIDEDASRRSGRTEKVTDPRLIAKRYIRSYFLIDILAILPIPQALLPIIFSIMKSKKVLDARKFLKAFVLLQYVPRVLRIYLSWRNLIESSRRFASRVWVKATFNIFLYILGSHALGAFWYFISIEREVDCWHIACANSTGCTPAFKCGPTFRNYTFLDHEDVCLLQTPNSNSTLVDFGIFREAVQSGTVTSKNIPEKIMYCFWWGLRNLSSLGQNLETSTYIWENIFAAFISIFGLLLFLYFIGNVQTYLQMATEKSEVIEQNMKNKVSGIQLWISKNELPNDMKERIISCVRNSLKENDDFDTEKPIPFLPKDLRMEIKYHLCLPLVKNVEILKNKGEYLRRMICESLKPLYYNEDSYIIREGEPLNVMLFITQGSVCCFKTSDGENDKGTASGPQYIEKDGFYGEELLEWGFNSSPSPKLSDLPISTKTIKTLARVEAFALTANDLTILVTRHSQAATSAKAIARAAHQRIRIKTIP